MRSIVLTFLLTLLLTVIALGDVQLPLPDNHWALDIMATMADRGIVPGYTSFDFKGRKSFTREEFAASISAVLDYRQTNPGAFSDDDESNLARLIEEFAPELETIGEIRKTAPPPASPTVPSNHWSYRALADFAESGKIMNPPDGLLLGDKLFTRTELASMTKQILDYFEAAGTQPDPEDARTLKYLEIEFEAELAALPSQQAGTPQLTTTEPVEPVRENAWEKQNVQLRGSSNLTIGVTKGNKTSISDRITVDGKGENLQLYFSGTLDNSGQEGEDFDFGHEYTLNLTRKLVGWHTKMNDKLGDTFLLAGDINNIEFANGLSVGAANIKGFFLSAAGAGESRWTAFWGDDDDGVETSAARYETGGTTGWFWSASVAREKDNTNTLVHSYDMNVDYKLGSMRLSTEYSGIDSGGYGFYSEAQYDTPGGGKFKAELRRYRDLLSNLNNPPLYLGRSGGNAENERSFYIGFQKRMTPKWTFSINRDHAFTPLIGTRTNVFVANEYRFSSRFISAFTWEKEQGSGPSEIERNLRMKFTSSDDTSFSGSWKRSIRSSGPTSTSRLDYNRKVMSGDGKFIYSFTRQKTWTRRTNTSRFRLNRRYDNSLSVSISYSYSGTSTNRLDGNLSWKF